MASKRWVFSPSVHLDGEGKLVDLKHCRFIWLQSTGDSSINDTLACEICTPLDEGECLRELYAAIEAFIPDNAIACLAAMACCVMGAAYEEVIKHCGHTGVPFLVGEPGSCKTEALLCALSLFGADHSHFLNSQTTPSYLFNVLKRTTIPLAVDDINDKAQDTWEELIVDTCNNTARGTRSYSVESFCTLPMVSANWSFTSQRGRAFTRCITIPFNPHTDEPNAPQLFCEMVHARRKASKSVSVLVDSCHKFCSQEAQSYLQDVFPNISAIYGSAHTCFKSTISVFMYFFLKVGIIEI